MGITNDLERLVELHRSGALSDAEFASAKARALGSTPHRVDGLGERAACAAPQPQRPLARRRVRRHGACDGAAVVAVAPDLRRAHDCGGAGVILYVLLWILLPKEPASLDLASGTFRST